MNTRILRFFVFLALLSGCVTEEARNSEQINITTSTVTNVEVTPEVGASTHTTSETHVDSDHTHISTPVGSEQEMSDGWSVYSWNELNVPLPPHTTWQNFTLTPNQVNGLSVEAAGMIVYNSELSSPSESPEGPFFVILNHTGTITDWLELEINSETSTGNPVQEDTIREVLVAGILGRAYRRAITGTGFTEYYAVKLDNDLLLWITSNDSTNILYNQIIEKLAVYH